MHSPTNRRISRTVTLALAIALILAGLGLVVAQAHDNTGPNYPSRDGDGRLRDHAPTIPDWTAGSYTAGEQVAHAGCLWTAQHDTTVQPGTSGRPWRQAGPDGQLNTSDDTVSRWHWQPTACNHNRPGGVLTDPADNDPAAVYDATGRPAKNQHAVVPLAGSGGGDHTHLGQLVTLNPGETVTGFDVHVTDYVAADGTSPATLTITGAAVSVRDPSTGQALAETTTDLTLTSRYDWVTVDTPDVTVPSDGQLVVAIAFDASGQRRVDVTAHANHDGREPYPGGHRTSHVEVPGTSQVLVDDSPHLDLAVRIGGTQTLTTWQP